MTRRRRCEVKTTTTTKTRALVACPTDGGAAEKRVVLIRHGQSLANVARGRARRDPSLRDCGITRHGVEQAEQAGRNRREEPELVVVSPLTRALLTALHMRYERAPLVVHPAVCEFGFGGGNLPENCPRPVRELLRTRALCELPRFPEDVDFSLLPSGWPAGDPASLSGFLDWLRARPERHVHVVCHHNVIQGLVRSGSRVDHCEPYVCRLTSRGLEEEASEMCVQPQVVGPSIRAPSMLDDADAAAHLKLKEALRSEHARRGRASQTTGESSSADGPLGCLG